MSKKKKTSKIYLEDNNEYNSDIEKANELLFYRKKEILKYLNRKVPFVVFPYKYMKIEDISFIIADFNKVFIYLHTTEFDKVITSKNGVPVHYNPPGIITVGPGLEYEEKFIKKTEEVLKGYIQILETLKDKYPNKTIYFGRNNQEFIDKTSCLEKTFYLKRK